jgi:hypothetical protein
MANRKNVRRIVIGIPIALLAVGILTYVEYIRSGVSERDAAVARAVKAGLPGHYDDVKHEINPEVDANQALMNFAEALRIAEKTPSGKAVYSSNLEQHRAAIPNFLRENAKLLQLRDEVLSKTDLATITDPAQGASLMFPQFAPAKGLCKLSAFEAAHLAETGQAAKAIHLLTKVAKFNQVVNADSTLIAELVAIANRAILIRAVEGVLTEAGPSADVILSADEFLVANRSNIDVRRALRSEMAMALATEEQLKNGKVDMALFSGGSSDGENGQVRNAYKFMFSLPGFRDRNFAVYYDGLTKLYSEMPADPSKSRERIAAMSAFDKWTQSLQGPYAVMSQIFLPVFSQAAQAEARALATERALAGVIGAAKIKLQTGKYPAANPAMGVDTIDPFTNEPMRYRADEKSVLVYSVGQDLQDDDGQIRRDNNKKGEDVGVQLPQPSSRRLR